VTSRVLPVARIDPVDRTAAPIDISGPLAGSALVWFEAAHIWEAGRIVESVLLEDLTAVAQDRLTRPRAPLCGLSLDRPRLMGILNVTPDSFSDGGAYGDVDSAVARAAEMAERAGILDIGGESTRPGAEPVPLADEIARTVPVIGAIRAAGITTPISIDTRKAAVAEAALAAGADMVNDVSALTYDPDMAGVVAAADVPVCLMHAKGDPRTMQDDPRYGDVLGEVCDWLEARVEAACAAGIARDKIILDPGIGFGKTLQHNLTLLRALSLYHDLGLPLLVGASRKRFIGEIGQAATARDRVAGSVAVALQAAAQGAHILRVHDVVETAQALALWQALARPGESRQ